MKYGLTWLRCGFNGARKQGGTTPDEIPSGDDREAISLLSSTMRELLEALELLCNHLRRYSEPFEPDEYDRLGLLLLSMIGAAEDACRTAAGAAARRKPNPVLQSSSATRYEQLAETLGETRQVVKLLLRSLRPHIDEHAQTIALIERLSAASAKARPWAG